MNRTKQEISEAFWQLLEEMPYSKITVKEIADRCQLNRNTFYYHFQDIPALAEATMAAWVDDIVKLHFQFGNPQECLTPLVEGCIARKRAILHIYRSVQRDVFLRHLRSMIRHAVGMYAEGVKSTLGADLETLPVLCHFYQCAGMGLVLDWLDQDMGYDMSEFLEVVCVLFQGTSHKALLRRTYLPGGGSFRRGRCGRAGTVVVPSLWDKVGNGNRQKGAGA